MPNLSKKNLDLPKARQQVNELLTDDSITVTKLDLRLVSGGYKLIATTHPVEQGDE